jgi:preprotein translocase subunit SecA
MPVNQWLEEDSELHEESLRRRIEEETNQAYQTKVEGVGAPVIRHLEKAVMLRVLDEQWKEHLSNMDHLRQGIGLRGYAQKNPKQEYKREAFEMFTAMLQSVKHDVITILSRFQIQTENDVTSMEAERRSQNRGRHEYLHPDTALSSQASQDSVNRNLRSVGELGHEPSSGSTEQKINSQPFVRVTPKVGRNELCPCGSGKKYKHCHGKL